MLIKIFLSLEREKRNFNKQQQIAEKRASDGDARGGSERMLKTLIVVVYRNRHISELKSINNR